MAPSLTANQAMSPDQSASAIVLTDAPTIPASSRVRRELDRVTISAMLYPARGRSVASACARFPAPTKVTVCFAFAIFAEDNRGRNPGTPALVDPLYWFTYGHQSE